MKKIILSGLTILSLGASAQTYTEITGTPFTGSTNPEMAFFDKDGDGDLDVVISSYHQTDHNVHADLYENDGNGNFTVVTSPFLGCHSGEIGVGDIDGDNDIDIIINGKSLTTSLTTVYINDGVGNFTIKTNTGIMGLFGFLELEDMDGDGDLDLIISGSSQPNYPYNELTYSYENDGAGNFTATQILPSNMLLTGIQVFDVDNDGDNDILTSNPYNGKQILFYENLNNTSYAQVDTLMTGVAGKLELINADGNNFTDLIIGGVAPDVYTNNGNKTFTKVIANSFGTYSSQRFCVADFNGDGTEDFIVVGLKSNPSLRSSTLYYNNGAGVFTEAINSGFAPVRNGGVIAGDIDNNGELEVLLFGGPSGAANAEINSLYRKTPVVCTVNIPDANFKAYLIGNTNINTNSNTEIECTEATAFTGAISCSNLSISDMSGIESFPNLTFLECRENAIDTLNLSQNTNLVTVFCRDNNMNELILGQNTNLQTLWCYQNNLSELDLTGVTALRIARLAQNNLDSIDIAQNVLLEELEIGQNNLDTIDVIHNTLLTKLFVSENNIRHLDLSYNTALTELFCAGYTSLHSLNLKNGNNTNVTFISLGSHSFLNCIDVDSPSYSYSNWSNFLMPTGVSYETNCSAVSTEINDNKKDVDLYIYPNPTIGKVQFSTTEKIKSIEIYNLAGQKVSQFQKTNTINISNLPKGIYNAKVITKSSKLVIVKLIKL